MNSNVSKTKKIAIIAATFSGNKGAASMLESIIDNVTEKKPTTCFDVLTVYPIADKAQNPYENASIVSWKPEELVFISFPLSILYLLFKWLPPVKTLLLKNKILKSLYSSDFVVDAAGISFVDNRGWVMSLYNFICVFVPIALDKKIIKFSQAIGPCHKFPNKLLAKLILPKIHRISARGRITMDYLTELGLKNLELCTDGAFVLPDSEKVINKVNSELSNDNFYKEKVIGISVSSVVYKYCLKTGIDYIKTLSEFIQYLNREKNLNVLILPQSAREGKTKLKNNDLPVCKMVFDAIPDKTKCRNLDKELSAKEIREYISKCYILVASRFHAMISALRKNVPVMLVGWGHKYGEILENFTLENYSVDYKKLDLEVLKKEFEHLYSEREIAADKIKKYLPMVEESSYKNIQIILDALESK